MFKTPPIPDSIKTLAAPPGHINPFQAGIDGPNLFGTETLCGDWHGDLLLVAQDFAPAAQFRSVLARHGPQAAWRHNDGDGRYGAGGDTNPRICALLASLGRKVDLAGRNAAACGTLYINACFFLAEGKRGPSSAAFRDSAPVVRFVLAHMKQLRTIACLGRPAFGAMGRCLGFRADWRTLRDSRRPVLADGYRVHALSHPGALGTINRLPGATWAEKLAAVEGDWAALAL